jgi:uncharacterized alpha-E superfamily protein
MPRLAGELLREPGAHRGDRPRLRPPGRRGAQVCAIRARLENCRMEEIFQSGLHEFIDEFIDSNNRLGAAVTEQYLM